MCIIIIDNYDSFTYNLYQMIQTASDRAVRVFRNDAITFDALRTLKPSHVVLSPGPGHPGNSSDFGVCADIILRQDELGCPVLGICLGHQGIAHYLGGSVVRAPEIVHGKQSEIRVCENSDVFKGIDSVFTAMRYHSLIIDETSLPESLEVIARDEKLGLPMAVQHRRQPLFGLQFHPESIGSPNGSKIMRNFLTL